MGVAFTATVSQPGEVMALAMATARGLLMLMLSPRLMLTSDMVDSTAMVLVWAMAATAMEALATDTARGPLMLRPSPRLMLTSDMVDSTATVLVWAMAAMAMEVLATLMERGPLTPSLRLMPGTDTVASTATDSQPMAVMATDCGERSKHYQKHRLIICNKPNDLI